MNSVRPCIFGEVLFDRFPDGSSVLGGAPFNVAWHLQAFGQAPRLITRIGDDPPGREIHAAMTAWGMDTDMLQVDQILPTGQVTVTLAGNEPSYDIVRPSAYDAIDTPDDNARCDVLYHGSLAARDGKSAATLEQLLARQPQLVFVDVNLRSPWWNPPAIQAMLGTADWIKINDDELARLFTGDDAATRVAKLFATHRPKGVLVTHGAKGAELYLPDGVRYSVQPRGRDVEIVDTVGAGDAFASVFLLGLLRQWELETILERAQAFASQLVQRRGATVNDFDFYQAFIDDWQLAN